MNILLIDLDSKIPNLPLMKISSYHKNKGDKIFLNKGCDPDKVYISCIFDKNKSQALGLSKMFNCDVIIGGYGVNSVTLNPEMEHIKPDYSLYNIDYSMGYTSRGCIRNCDFCIIPKKEGKIKNHSSIKEFVDPKHKKIMLLDNNFLASPKCRENLNYIKENNLKVSFCQGLDIRLINNKNSKLLSEVRYSNISFNHPTLYFAWDNFNEGSKVIKGVNVLKNNGIKPYKLMFYILVNFNTTFQQDYHRFQIIKDMGADPFIMPYNGGTPLLRHFARWVNRRVYKVCAFKDYDRLGNKMLPL